MRQHLDGFPSNHPRHRYSRQEAQTRLGERWEVILLDQKLRGPYQGNDGLDLLREAQKRCPGARAILITAYPEPAAVKNAFDLGAYDYLEKNIILESILQIKIRNVLAEWREREGGRRVAEEALQNAWEQIPLTTQAQEKGRLLEQVMVQLFRTIPGLERVKENLRTPAEELDVTIENHLSDPFWQKWGAYILIECKNWSQKTDAKAVREFASKMRDRHGFCKLGIFVALGGFTEPVTSVTQNVLHRDEQLLLTLTQAELGQVIQAPSIQRLEVLAELVRAAAIGK